jgi:uncharacterized membrane protein (DUF4010 family)
VLISGLLGGLYSSTATTMILSRRAKDTNPPSNEYASSIIAATGMMYFRVLILMFIFNGAIFSFLLPYTGTLFVISLVISGVVYVIKKPVKTINENFERNYSNPLELKIAMLFAVLFVLFSLITQYVIQNYGNYGLDILSYIIGFTDIDPFLLNLFRGNYTIGIDSVSKAVLQAIASNNILKAGYTYVFADKATSKYACTGLILITLLNIIFAVLI